MRGSGYKTGKADLLRDGTDAVIFTSGLMVHNSLEAANLLADEELSVRVINIHTIKPIDKEAIVAAAQATGAVVTAENHSVINGLGSAVSDVLGEYYPVPIQQIGVKDEFGEVGKMEYLMQRFQLMPSNIAAAVREAVRRKR